MDTLYDLLGALPRDDAEELRVAFRRAVKGTHPDLHPGDPDAGFKFRQIVRANEILADPDQRKTYDHLLDLAEEEKKELGKRAFMHRAVAATSFVLSLGFISAASVGGYLLFQQMSEEPSAPVGKVASAVSDVTAGVRDPFETAPAPAPAAPIPVTTISIPVTPPKSEVASTEKIESAEIVPASVTLASATEPAAAPPLGPPLEIAPPPDAKAYRDRGIVLYRMQKFERAFADIAHARRIAKSKGTKTALGRKPRTGEPAIEISVTPPPLPRARRTARLDSLREVGFLVNRQQPPPY